MIARSSAGNLKLEISDLKGFVTGADVFSKQNDGSPVVSQYGKLGITPSTDRVNGWAEILHCVGDPGSFESRNADNLRQNF